MFFVAGVWFGDPHIITSDGLSYTFNGLGEFLMTKIGDDTIIQTRTERVTLEDGSMSLLRALFSPFKCVVCLTVGTWEHACVDTPGGRGYLPIKNSQGYFCCFSKISCVNV